jgi:hypothetical protein
MTLNASTGNLSVAYNLTVSGGTISSGPALSSGYFLGGTGHTYIQATSGTAYLDVTPSGVTVGAGNLTVSGGTITGGASGMSLASGGTNQNITLTPSGTGKLVASNGTTAVPLFDITNTNTVPTKNGLRILGPNASSSSARQWAFLANSTAYGDLEFRRSTTSTADPTSGDYIFGASAGGNFLIGTTTDGGQKLQVAGTSYFNGAATFTSSGTLTGSTTIKLLFVPGALGTYGTSNILRWYRADGTTQRALIGYGSGNDQVFYLATEESGGSLVFQTGSSTTALTLDTSQNATFAGNVTVSGSDKNVVISSTAESPALLWTATGGNAANRNWKAVINNSENGDWGLYQSTTAGGAASTKRFSFNQSGNATFAGAIAIGNTVNTVSPTSPNRTITMVIGGTTYYIHAKTTND